MPGFTAPITVTAVPGKPTGWRRILPPGWQRPSWKVVGGFSFRVHRSNGSNGLIEVPDGFIFDGASVPLVFRALVPMAHPDYIQAAALHDYLLSTGRPRHFADRLFADALAVLRMPEPWRSAMIAAVRIGSIRAAIRDTFSSKGTP